MSLTRTTKRSTRWLAAVIGASTVAGAIVSASLLVVTRSVAVLGQFAFRGWDVPLSLAFGVVGALMATRRPSNPVGWLMASAGSIGALGSACSQYATLSLDRYGGSLMLTGFTAWFQNVAWVPLLGTGIILPLLLFPDGRLLSARWRPVLWAAIAGVAIFSFAIGIDPVDLQSLPVLLANPYGMTGPIVELAEAIGGSLFTGSLLACAAGVVLRYRRSRGLAREQMRWLAFGGSLMGIAFGVGAPMFFSGMEEGPLLNGVEIAIVFGIASIPVAMGIAILNHGLLDIDVVINKALVFGALAGAITALYLAVIVGIGAAVGTRGEPNVALSVAATAAVALAFQPLRVRAQRLANRFVYGARATPDEVLSGLGTTLAEAVSFDVVMAEVARLATEATAASRAEVWVRVGAELRRESSWPDTAPSGAVSLAGDELPALGASRVFPVRHQQELLGALAVDVPANDGLSASDERLLADLGSHAGLVLRNVRLIEELRASRQRLVAAQDQERRRIERNLHDGAQQELVALNVKLSMTRPLLAADPARAETMLTEAQADLSTALENLRALARGIYPPMLAENGLTMALRAQAERAALPVEVDGEGIGRFSMEVESAVYFCVLEALQNVAKYAGASGAHVRLTYDDGSLRFSVTDDGAGFDVSSAKHGAGTQNMTDRLEALGGSLRIESTPGVGTSVTGSLPAPQADVPGARAPERV